MQAAPDILCIGSVLWDILGHAARPPGTGADVPGRIRHRPGGVAYNIAAVLARLGLAPALLSAVGTDAAGEALLDAAAAAGIDMAHVHRVTGAPTDRYMAIEAEGRLLAAVADAHTLERAGAAILAPLEDGRLAGPGAPWRGPVAVDGNLTVAMLERIAAHPALAEVDLRLAPASPGKAGRLVGLLRHPQATLYLNLHEAEALCGETFAGAEAAAVALWARGARRVLVTDGARRCAEAGPEGVTTRVPPSVTARQATGAGDTFMAAHIRAEMQGMPPEDALQAALAAAAAHVAGAPV